MRRPAPGGHGPARRGGHRSQALGGGGHPGACLLYTSFLESYYASKIYESDPFARLDQTGVGRLVAMACKLGRSTNPDLHLGVGGEHGGDPSVSYTQLDVYKRQD